jgi:hypothetical protein
LCRVGLGNPYSTRGSTALPHLYTGLNRLASSPSLAKVLSQCGEVSALLITFALLSASSRYTLFINDIATSCMAKYGAVSSRSYCVKA